MNDDAIALHWLDRTPALRTGVSFGVPWSRGTLRADDALMLHDAHGRNIPTQHWPLAWWPDGSVKWTGVAATLGPNDGPTFHLRRRTVKTTDALSSEAGVGLRITSHDDRIEIDAGTFRCHVPRYGPHVLERIMSREHESARDVALVCVRQRQRENGEEKTTQRMAMASVIEQLEIEQHGPRRAVVRLDGTHRDRQGHSFLPFVLRLYFHAGAESVRMVHTFIYDGDAHRDAIAGLGVRCRMAMADPPPRRRVWLAGDDGAVWSEPVQWLPPTRRAAGFAPPKTNPQRQRQTKLEPFDLEPCDTPIWHRFALTQVGPDQFVIRKGTGDGALIDAHFGQRSAGLGAVSDAHAGLALGIADFWQAHPSGIEIQAAGAQAGDELVQLTAWLWPHDVPAADMRDYSHRTFPEIYETAGTEQGGTFAQDGQTPYGIARTSELLLFPLEGNLDRTRVARCAEELTPAILCCMSEHYHRTRVFGPWAPASIGGPLVARFEQDLTRIIDHYLEQIEQRRWYGFFHFGDIMHSYDPDRHAWRYDEGGYAWANAEVACDLWLWRMFLHTGRADVFRMAQAMTRHVSEVDVYHLGAFKGLGSRHNVVHWGCVCKEPRISMAGSRRFHYLLTTDERMAQMMDEACDAWPTEPRALVFAPSWSSLCWNWLCAWERTGDPEYERKMRRGIAGVLDRPHPLMDGAWFDFDPATGAMRYLEQQPSYDWGMTLPFGSHEVFMEMADLLDHAGWRQALAAYGQFFTLPREARARIAVGTAADHLSEDVRIFSAPLIAYAARHWNDLELARQAVAGLERDELAFTTGINPNTQQPVQALLRRERIVQQTTVAAQWSLSAIACIDLLAGMVARHDIS